MSEALWHVFMSWICRKFGHRAHIDYDSRGGGDPEICKRCDRLLSTRYSRSRALEVALSQIRANDPIAVKRYTEGDCYKLHLRIKAIYPEAEAWYDTVKAHVLTLYEGRLWDITGPVWCLGDQPAHVLPWHKLEQRVQEDAINWNYKEYL